MIYDLRNEYRAQDFIDKVKEMLEKQYIVTLSRKLPNRTLKQNNYLHLLISYFASEYGISIDEAKNDVFKRECNPDIFVREKENKKGRLVKYLRSTSELDTGEMTLAINRFRNRSVAYYEIYLPSPEDNEFMLYCEQEIERNQEFLSISVK